MLPFSTLETRKHMGDRLAMRERRREGKSKSGTRETRGKLLLTPYK